MRNNDDIIQFQRALNGSYEPIVIQPEQPEQPEQPKLQKIDSKSEIVPLKRTRRSLYNANKGRSYNNRKIRKVKLSLKTF